MVFRSQRYDRLAELFAYPEGDYAARLSACAGALEDGYADAAAALGPLVETVAGMSLEQIQELYTRIFGLQLGGAGRGAYGEPTGSMGWNPFVGPKGWSAYVGGFLRGEACFSARCEKRAAPVSSPAEMLE